MSEPRPLELQYFNRKVDQGAVIYLAKADAFYHRDDGVFGHRRFYACITQRGEFIINQNPEPNQPLLNAEAALELGNIYVDWLIENKHS